MGSGVAAQAQVQADYVIIGAGSAGSVLAARLSEDPSVRVVLLEAGGSGEGFWFRVPVGYAKLIGNPKTDWAFRTQPEPGIDGRVMQYSRGKALGGSSSINGLAWTFGSRHDYRRWAALGCDDWDYETVLPYLQKLENFPAGGPHRGKNGPVRVQVNPGQNAATRMFYDACLSAGLPDLPDPNVAEPFGVGRMQTNVGGGIRQSASRVYLGPARSRSNLTILTDVSASKLVIENGAATGVTFTRGGVTQHASAAREVIVCAGAVGSPLVLEAAGIGNAERLKALGIEVKADRPSVGENARDHYMVQLKMRLKGVQTLNGSDGGLRALVNGTRYILTRGGPLAATPTELIGFTPLPGEDAPSAIEFWCNPLTYDYRPIKGTLRTVMHKEPGMTISMYHSYPRSVGHVHLGADGKPEILTNVLTDPHDQRMAVEGLRFLRRMATLEPLASHVVSGLGLAENLGDGDDEMLAYVKAVGNSSFHLVGTCRMGADEDSVVDQQLRVRGVRRLRVADASVMPTIIGTHTNAPSMMIAERCAEFIRQPS